MEVKGDVGQVRVVVQQHLFEVCVANHLLPPTLVH